MRSSGGRAGQSKLPPEPLRRVAGRWGSEKKQRTGIIMYRVVSAAAVLLLSAFVPATAADLKILSPGATEGVLNEVLPQFEQASGHRAQITYGPAGNIANRVRKGEAVDVLISSEPEAERLRKEGKTVDGSQVIVAKVGIGIFVRKGD